MRGTRVTFRPPAWASLGVVAACTLFIAAGAWQLSRAAEKRALFASFAAGTGTAAIDGPVSDRRARQLRYRTIRLRGRYDGAHQWLLDNMIVDGRAGYQVLTPLRTGRGIVLVNRGWLPADPDRRRLPAIGVSEAERELTGRLDRLPVPGLRLGPPQDQPGGRWPRRVVFPTAQELAAQLGYPVSDYQVLLAPDQPDGYLRAWRPRVMSPRRHTGYAVQWFALAAALAVIYLVTNLKKQKP